MVLNQYIINSIDEKETYRGFRPLTGFMVLNPWVRCTDILQGRVKFDVSVPLRGLWFLIFIKGIDDYVRAMFPSPYGVYGS